MKAGSGVGIIARVGVHASLRAAGARLLGTEREETPFGASNPVHLVEHEGLRFLALSRHGEKGYETAAPWVNDRANLYAFKARGVEKVISFSSPGSCDPAVRAGDLVMPEDVLDERRSGPFTFFEGRGVGVIRQQHPFCPGLSARAAETLGAAGIPVQRGGVYVGTQGPRLETPAEIRKYRNAGGTVVGMTLVPEVFLARELELCYAPLCLVVNLAEGVREAPYRAGVLFEGLADEEDFERVAAVENRLGEILLLLVRAAADYPRDCDCGRAMERYRNPGDLGEDWRSWWA